MLLCLVTPAKITGSRLSSFSTSEEKKLRENIVRNKQAEILNLTKGPNRPVEVQRSLLKVRFENRVAEYKKLFDTSTVAREAKKSFNDLYNEFQKINSAVADDNTAVEKMAYLEARFACEFEENYKPELIKFLHQKTS